MLRGRRPRSAAGRSPSVPDRPLAAAYEPHVLPPDFPFRAVRWTHGDAPVERMHRHDVLEIGWCHAGAGEWLVDGRVFRYRAGCAVVVSRHQLHFSRSDGGTASEWTYLFTDPARLLAGLPDADEPAALQAPDFPHVLDPARHGDACRLVEELVREAEGARCGRRAAITGLLLALLARLRRLAGAACPSVLPPDLARLDPALRRLRACADGTPPVAALARACGMGASSFRRAFAAALGCPPRTYLLRLRVQRAMRALRDPARSVTDAALSAGFANPSAFARRFRIETGMTPREWRRRP